MGELICVECAASLVNTRAPMQVYYSATHEKDEYIISTNDVAELVLGVEAGAEFRTADGFRVGVRAVTQFQGTLLCTHHAAYMIQELRRIPMGFGVNRK